MNKTNIFYLLISLLTFCGQTMGNSTKQIYDPKDTKFLKRLKGKKL